MRDRLTQSADVCFGVAFGVSRVQYALAFRLGSFNASVILSGEPQTPIKIIKQGRPQRNPNKTRELRLKKKVNKRGCESGESGEAENGSGIGLVRWKSYCGFGGLIVFCVLRVPGRAVTVLH